MPVEVNVKPRVDPNDPETITIRIAPNADANVDAIDFAAGGRVGIHAAGTGPVGDLPQGWSEVIITAPIAAAPPPPP